MGIYDRDYYRESTDGWWSDWRGGRVTYALMGAVAALFVAEVLTATPMGGGKVRPLLQFDPAAIFSGEVWRLFTGHLTHPREAFFRVGFILVGIYYAGTRVESTISSREFLAFVLVAMLFISGVKLAAAATHFEPMAPTYGAAALTIAVLALFACVQPYERIQLIVSIPVWLFVALIVGYELLIALGDNFATSGRTAYLAAAGFAVAYYFSGVLLSNALFPRSLLAAGPAPRRRTRRPANLPELRVADEPAAVAAVTPQPQLEAKARPARARDEQLEAKLDQVLEKIARQGRGGLTAEEQEVLRQASELFKGQKNR